jgi:PAS domain S-box-containing protein
MLALENRLYTDRLAAAKAATEQSQILLIVGSSLSLALIMAIFTVVQREMAARKRSEESLTVTLNSIGDGVIATDAGGRITRLNPIAEELTAWTEAEARGRPIDDVFRIINEQTRQPAVIPVAEVLATGRLVGLANHTLLLSRDGREIAIADSCAPIRASGKAPIGTVLVFRDVTDERHAEIAIRGLNEHLGKRVEERTAALRESEERFHTFMEASPLMAWVKDEAGRYQFMNKACADILSLSPQEWIGKTLTEFQTPEVAERVRNIDLNVLRSSKPIEAIDDYPDTTGHRVRLRIIRFPFKSATGEPLIGGVAIDITQQAATEEQLRQAQKMEAVGQLTGGIAHDFNNLLAVIIGNLDYVTEKLQKDSPPLVAIEEALTAALRGAELTRQLLSFSRQQSLQPRLLKINPIVEETAKLLRRTLGETIDIKLELTPTLWPVEADPAMLDSALMNLAVNARDAMPTGGSLIIKTDNCQLDDDYVTLNPDVRAGDYVRLSVSDTGAGMPPEVIARAFDPFFTTKPVGRGTGLGLSMVHGFVKQSGGNVKIYSELHYGTTISLYLPRANAVEEASETTPAISVAIGTGETILVVEDNPAVRKLVAQQLHELGYTVVIAADGPAAMNHVTNGEKIDLLFTDVVMPGGMSGPDLAREARKLRPNLRVLFSSGFPRDASRSIGPDLDDMLLSKPYRRADLAAKIREVLNADR